MYEWEGRRKFVNILGNSWSVEDGPLLYFYCKHNHIHIHDHNIYLDIQLIPYTNDIHLTAPDMPSQIPTLFSPCPSSIFTCTRTRMPSRADNRSYPSRPPSLSMAQEHCPAPSEASLNSLPKFLDPSSR